MEVKTRINQSDVWKGCCVLMTPQSDTEEKRTAGHRPGTMPGSQAKAEWNSVVGCSTPRLPRH